MVCSQADAGWLGFWRFWLFSIWKLPMAFIARMRVKKLTTEDCVVSVPYNYINKNPFYSIYFAVQAMAAELSTGALVLLHVDQYNISTLVTKLDSQYFKKATTKINFICLDGDKLSQVIRSVIETGEGVSCVLKSRGYDKEGVCVSEFNITWSLKLRKG